MQKTDPSSPKYDVALSFAGEEREIASRLATALTERGLKVFFDEFEKDRIWGKNLYDFLSDVYLNQARLCVMFISEAYASRVWTNHERRSAQARALRESAEYILPIRIDNADVPGVLSTVAFLPYEDYTIEEIANLIVAKLADNDEMRISAIKPSVEQYASLGATIPDAEVVASLGRTELRFKVQTGKVVELREAGDNQAIWIVVDGHEVTLNVPDSMLRLRKGHVVSCMNVEQGQRFPVFLVAAMNYSTQRLTLATEHIRSLATASNESVPGCGCWFSIAIVALLWSLSASSSSQALPLILFFGVIILGLLVSHRKRTESRARIRELGSFLAGQYGFEAPADLQSEGRRYVECLPSDSGDIH